MYVITVPALVLPSPKSQVKSKGGEPAAAVALKVAGRPGKGLVGSTVKSTPEIGVQVVAHSLSKVVYGLLLQAPSYMRPLTVQNWVPSPSPSAP
jgi:hypothetical protein